MKKVFAIILTMQFAHTLFSQTWTGASNTSWNNAANWNPATVPVAGSNVTIPATATGNRWPMLASNVSINGINMADGSQLNVNGFSFTLLATGGFYSVIGGTINNTNAASDIVFNINTGTGGYTTVLHSTTFNDNVIFNLSGSNQFLESVDGTGNIFNGDVVYNVASDLSLRISVNGSSLYNGNLDVTRTTAGPTEMFSAGGSVTGNFSFTNNTAGDTRFGSGSYRTAVGGKVDITAKYTTPGNFQLYRLINQISGGVIEVQNSRAMDVQSDTLKLLSCSITGYTGNAYAYLVNNFITANVTISDDPSYGGGYVTFLRSNIITGTFTISNRGTNQMFDADQANTGNTYNGNAFFNAKGTGAIYLSHGAFSLYNGNLTITRTADGTTQAFAAGGTVKGNLSYTNLVNGTSVFGNGASQTVIAGTLNVAVKNTTTAGFTMYRLTNKINGGSLNLEGTRAFDFQLDTLQLVNFSCQKYTGNAYAYLLSNSITANVNVADDLSYSGGYDLKINNNRITGNASFTHKGSNNINEADGQPNIFNGNTSFTMQGSGALYVSHGAASQFNGNLSITRNITGGHIQAFNAGGNVTGNFSYTNLVNGNSYFGNTGNRTMIHGTVTINVKNKTPGDFVMNRLINQTNGGSLSLDSTKAFSFQNDTLLLSSFTCQRYYGSAYAYLLHNDITGVVSIADDVSYSGGYNLTVNDNRVTGNASFTHKGTNNINEAVNAGEYNIFTGNTSFLMQGSGALYVSHAATSQFNGDLVVTRNTTAGHTQVFNAGGMVTGNFTFNNNIGGNCYLGRDIVATNITGQVNFNVQHISTGDMQVLNLKNQTAGGVISILDTRGFNFRNDTLTANTISITGYRGNAYAYLLNNQLTADVTLADDLTYGGGYNTSIRDNIINGNTSITDKGSNNINESDAGSLGNYFNGNVTFVRSGIGVINIGQSLITEVAKNFTIGGAGGISINNLRFKNNTASVIAKTGTIPIVIKNLYINKAAAGNVTLNDSVQVSQTAAFTSGIVVSAANKELIFLNGVSYTGVSDISHVKGPVSKFGNQAFAFPIGNGQAMQKATISAPSASTDRFRAEYFDVSPHPTYDTTKRAAALKVVNGSQYWIVERLVGTSNVTVELDYGKPRGIAITAIQANLRVAKWSGSTWLDLGNGGTTGTATEGTVITAAPVTSFSPFTIAATSVINPMPNTAGALPAPACANTTISVPFQSSGVFNAGNVFKAQLSDASGNFTNPVVIGTLALAPDGIAVDNSISAFLPSSAIVTGTGYRVRVVSSSPVNNGTVNSVNLTINSLYIGPDVTVLLNCLGTSTNLTNLYNTNGLSPVWNTGNPSSVGVGVYRLSVQNQTGCRDTALATVIFEVATWTGTVSSDWHVPGNWSINKVPSSKTHVIIPTGAANPCIISATNATAASVQVRKGAIFNATNNKKLVVTGTCSVLPQ